MDSETLNKVLVGTSGWSYDDWVGPFYAAHTAARDYLSLYAEYFRSVEVDSTFYAIPAASRVQGWASRTPPDFRFAPKVPGIVTHGAEGERARVDKVLIDEGGALETFLERALLLGEKLAVVLFQFPYFRVKELALAEFLPRLDTALARTAAKLPPDARAAVEVRNKTWITPEYLAALAKHRAAAVLVDHPYMPAPAEQLSNGMVTSDIAYIRLLGDRYKIEEKTKTWAAIVEDKSSRLEQWADVIRQLAVRPELRRIYTFSNNHFAGHAPATSRELRERIERTS